MLFSPAEDSKDSRDSYHAHRGAGEKRPRARAISLTV